MGLSFQQTDTPAVYTGPSQTGLAVNGGGTVDRLCIGTPGSVVNLITLDALGTHVYAVSFDIPVPFYTLWNGGEWKVRLNVSRPNQCVTWNSVYLYRLNSAGVVQQLLGVAQPLALNLLTPGTKEAKVEVDASPTRLYGDRVLVVLGFVNGGTLPPYNLTLNKTTQVFGFTADQTIDSPLVG